MMSIFLLIVQIVFGIAAFMGAMYLILAIIWAAASLIENGTGISFDVDKKHLWRFVAFMLFGVPFGILVSFLYYSFAYSPTAIERKNAKLEKENDSLRNQINIYMGMNKDVYSNSLEEIVYYIPSMNQSFYHVLPDCHGLVLESGRIKSETKEKAIEEGKIPCSICVGKIMPDTEIKKESTELEEESVYICTGETSTKYHCDPDCRGLSRCSGEIEEVSEEEAENMGRTPCKICY